MNTVRLQEPVVKYGALLEVVSVPVTAEVFDERVSGVFNLCVFLYPAKIKNK